jgi:uncharacterized membrane protein
MNRLEGVLANVLQYGTWVASATIVAGLALALTGSRMGVQGITIGIALFIMLPVLRVAVMLAVFLLERDYRFSAIAATVLTIICVGFALGRL